MENNKDELNVKEELTSLQENKNESLADSRKIDLYINNNDDNQDGGISIMNVFTFMKQRFHIFIFVILITFFLGLLIPIAMYTFKDKNEQAVAIMGLDYDGAESGLAPDGSNLDISYLKSSYIIQNALNNVTLSKNVSVALVQSNLTITGVLTDETKQQKEVLDALKADKSTEYAKLIQNFTLKYRAQYLVSLNCTFEEEHNKFTLSSTDTSHLLTAIIDAYSKYFIETYQDKTLPNNYIGAIDTNTLDYLDILDEIQSSLSYLENYCTAKTGRYGTFRGSDGLTFSDLANTIHTIKNTDIDYIYSYIYLNNVSKYPETQLTNYRYQKREASLELAEVNESITTVTNSINNYKADKVVVSNPDSGAATEVEVNSSYYNDLVLELSNLNARKSALEERIAILDKRIERLEGPAATEEQVAKAATYIDSALANANSLYNIVNDHSSELFESNSYQNQYMHYITTFENDSITNHLKMFLIGAAAGLFVGLAIWGVDALVLEFKDANKRQNAKEAK